MKAILPANGRRGGRAGGGGWVGAGREHHGRGVVGSSGSWLTLEVGVQGLGDLVYIGALHVEGHRVGEDQGDVGAELRDRSVLRALELSLHCAEVHWSLDEGRIRRQAEPLPVDRLEERDSRRVALQLVQDRKTLLHRLGRRHRRCRLESAQARDRASAVSLGTAKTHTHQRSLATVWKTRVGPPRMVRLSWAGRGVGIRIA